MSLMDLISSFFKSMGIQIGKGNTNHSLTAGRGGDSKYGIAGDGGDATMTQVPESLHRNLWGSKLQIHVGAGGKDGGDGEETYVAAIRDDGIATKIISAAGGEGATSKCRSKGAVDRPISKYVSQPIACPVCGKSVSFQDEHYILFETDSGHTWIFGVSHGGLCWTMYREGNERVAR